MNFESLVINAIGDQIQIVVRQLMDVGLLNATQYRAKDLDRKTMILQENQKQWRCSKCTASKSILKDSFFESTNTPLETWVVVLDSCIKELKLQEIATSVDISRKSISEMLRHFREQCQTDLVGRPLVLGGHGTRVLVKELKKCGDRCKILFALKQGDQTPYLLHNVNNRIFNESIPVAERTTIFTDIRNLTTPNNTLNIMEITLFQGNVENPKNHALQWLRKKRRIKFN